MAHGSVRMQAACTIPSCRIPDWEMLEHRHYTRIFCISRGPTFFLQCPPVPIESPRSRTVYPTLRYKEHYYLLLVHSPPLGIYSTASIWKAGPSSGSGIDERDPTPCCCHCETPSKKKTEKRKKRGACIYSRILPTSRGTARGND